MFGKLHKTTTGALLAATILSAALFFPALASAQVQRAVELSYSGTRGDYLSGGLDCEASDANVSVPGGTRISSDERVTWSNAGDARYWETVNIASYLYWYGNGKWNYWMTSSQSATISAYYGTNSFKTYFDFPSLPTNFWYKVETAITWTQNGRTLGSALYGLTQPAMISATEPVSYMTLTNWAAACKFN
jgi:hypothetical protein